MIESTPEKRKEKQLTPQEKLCKINGESQNAIVIDFNKTSIDKEEFNELIQKAVNKIETSDKNQIYASGSEGDIFIVNVLLDNGETKKLLVAKKRFDNNPNNEYSLHEKISKIVKDGDPVKVPKLRGQFKSKGHNYIVMDFIEGKTLYHKIAEGIIEAKAKQIEASATGKTETEKNIAYQEAFNLRNEIKSAKSDSDVDHIFLKWYQYDSKKTTEAFDREKLKVQIFGSKEGKKINADLNTFIELLHDNGFYHRDLHEKNIIFGDDGKIYVIDFGKTFFKDPKKGKPSDTEVYIVDMGEQEGIYVKDEDILGIIGKITKTKSDEEEEEFAKQKKEEAKNLTKGQMIIKEIDFSKIKSKKILNRIKKYFGSYEQLKKEVEKEDKWEHTIDSFIGVSDEDFILTLFSITKENLELILNQDIPNKKNTILKKIKSIWYNKLGEQSRNNLFGNDNTNIDVNNLKDVLSKMYNKKGYEEIYKNKGLNFINELKPMLDGAIQLVNIKEIQSYLKEINNAINE